jgi:hypothetical protein
MNKWLDLVFLMSPETLLYTSPSVPHSQGLGMSTPWQKVLEIRMGPWV